MPDPTPAVVLNELTATRVELSRTVDRMRQRNRNFALLAILSVVILVGYLGYAAYRFGGEVTPDLLAVNLQSKFQQSLPQARSTLEKHLAEKAPKFVADAFGQLESVPNRFADQLHDQAKAKMDEAMPGVQDQMYASMKQALDKSTGHIAAAGDDKAKDDEARLQSALASVGEVYATETLKFVDEQHAAYARQANEFTDYLDRLASSDKLDHRDQLHRDMFRSVFALVRYHAANSHPAETLELNIAKPKP